MSQIEHAFPKILVVDDIPENLIALKQVFKFYDYQLITASSGNEALQLSLEHEFSLALVDIYMPEMDGYELANFLLSNPKTSNTPIIFLTASHNDETNIFKAYQSGAVDYLTKPICPDILLSKVRILVSLYQAKKEAELSQEKAEQANVAKTLFLNHMSHELRTPLNAILGFSQILLFDKKNLPNNYIEYIQEIENGGKHLLTLIDDLLDMSAITAGKLSLHYENIDLDSLLKACIETISPAATERNLNIDYSPVSLNLNTDPLRLKQVLLNLLSNAVKYNCDNGQIILSVSQTASTIHISVTDTGEGMTQTEIDSLFKPYNRLGRKNKHIQGTGLGLSISKQLIELMKGKIAVRQHQPQGSVFWIELPIK